MAQDDEREVLSSLPRTRPQRRSAKRGAVRATPSTPTAAARTTAAATAAPKAAAKAKPKAAAKAKPKAAAKRTPAAKPTPKPKAAAKATPAAPRVPPAGYAPREGGPALPAGSELIGTAVQAAGELAQIGLAVGGQALRSALGRLGRR